MILLFILGFFPSLEGRNSETSNQDSGVGLIAKYNTDTSPQILHKFPDPFLQSYCSLPSQCIDLFNISSLRGVPSGLLASKTSLPVNPVISFMTQS
jgi:hypothetical protein